MPTTTPEFRLGEGKISGVIALVLSTLCLFAVLCFRYPQLLTTPMLRSAVPIEWYRGLLATCLGLSLLFSTMSIVLSGRRPWLGLAGMAIAWGASFLGGAQVPLPDHVDPSPYVGLDWFVLDLFGLALLFVPFERLFPRLPEQRVFRYGWRTDLAHFGISHLLVQITVLVTMAPAQHAFRWAVSQPLQSWVAALPLWLQFLAALFVADLTQYAIHRTFHVVPFLWRFHSIHHSSQEMDWLMGSRLHIVDILVTRSLTFVPLYLLGLSTAALNAYLVFVAFQAVFIHANTRLRFGPLRWVMATPEYHHWHHAAEREAIDKNFAVHLPLIDWAFGTLHLPNRWPRTYGIEGNPVPEGYFRQLAWPFENNEQLSK